MAKPLRVTWIIGATSGVGRASALALAGADRHLVLSGRREAELRAVADEVASLGGSADVLAVDASDQKAMDAATRAVATDHGDVAELLFSAGLNVPNRAWAGLRMPEFQAVVATNLTAAAGAIAGVLPGMRRRGAGRVVVVSSWAGWTYGRGAGVAYSASKTALKSLTESLNDQEGPGGVSACLLCPGDIDTPLIDNRPVVPTREQRDKMLTPEDVARAVRFVFEMPRHVAINELVISPIESHSYGR
jgi:NADP-dependent 3-hydroxy acid dehydrogenase YdfG